MSLKDKLYKMDIDDLEDELIENSGNYIKELVIKNIIDKKKQDLKEKKLKKRSLKLEKLKEIELKKKELNKKKLKKKEKKSEDKEFLKAEDFLDDILAFDDENETHGNEYRYQEDYDPILIEEVKKDSINNRVMERMNSDIFIKKNKIDKKKIESPYADNSDECYHNPNKGGLDPYDFSNNRFILD